MPPVQMGGQAATSHLVPALLPPHRKMTNSRLAAVTALFFGCDTRRVSQCTTGLPMKFVQKVDPFLYQDPFRNLLRVMPIIQIIGWNVLIGQTYLHG
jgi:hypothetical protein